MEVNLCKNSKKIEIDYSQNSVKIFFDQSAKCGQDGKKIIIVCVCFFFVISCRVRFFPFSSDFGSIFGLLCKCMSPRSESQCEEKNHYHEIPCFVKC